LKKGKMRSLGLTAQGEKKLGFVLCDMKTEKKRSALIVKEERERHKK
jgi:hypothetical protein